MPTADVARWRAFAGVTALLAAVIMLGRAAEVDTNRSPLLAHTGLAHTGLTGLLLLVGHIALAAALVGGLAAVETLARRLAATLSRWTRVMVWSIPSTPGP